MMNMEIAVAINPSIISWASSMINSIELHKFYMYNRGEIGYSVQLKRFAIVEKSKVSK